MNPIGDNVRSKSAKKVDILINSNGKGSHVGDSKSSKNSIESQRDNSCEDDDDDDLDDNYSSKSDIGSSKYKEVDRFGFVGGNQYTDPTTDNSLLPIEILRMRELKWLDMMENWEKWMSKRFKKVKERCRKGIPDSLRARAWQLLTGSASMLSANPGRYHGYVNSKGNPACLDEIRKDVSRQYPHHELFMDDQGQGQEDLYSVLMAYSIHDPSVGYCQAQGPLAAVLLTLMPAEQAFWTFLTVCEKYLPGYYNMGLEAVQIDSMILFGLLKKSCPVAYKHLKKQKVEPILWMTDWFMCLYSRTLPWPSVLRVWDMFLCEGVKVMFRVALVLVKSVLGTSEQLSKCPTFYETLDRLRKIPAEYMEENYLAGELAKLQLTDKDMEKEHSRQLKKWNASKAEKVQKNNSNSMISVAVTSTPRVDASSASKTSNSRAVLTSPSTISNSTLATSTASILATSAPSTTSESTISNPNRPTDFQVVQTANNPSKSSPILPPPGYLLLPNAISSNPSPKPLISLPESAKTTNTVPLPALGTAVTSPVVSTTTAFIRPTLQTSSDDVQSKAQKDKRLSKRFPFLSTKMKTKSLSNAPQEYFQPSAAGSKESVVEPIAIHEPFKRYQSKPSVSPCSSLSAVPQLPDKKRKTFRMSFYRPKASKSTTNIDQ